MQVWCHMGYSRPRWTTNSVGK